ncbi:hypothetical protein BH23VER1_BH23VER1_20560 [soil metagenome]
MARGRLIPTFFFALLAAGGLGIAFLLVQNSLRFPVLQRFPVDGAGSIAAYDRGFRHRAADLFYERTKTAAPVYIAPFFYAGRDLGGHPRARPEFLAWTADGTALFAVREGTRRDQLAGEDILWLFDYRSSQLAVAGAAADAVNARGGLGRIIAHHYDFGRKNPDSRLESWQTTRWERALP